MPNALFHLAANPAPFVAQSADAAPAGGTPRRRFLKDLIAVGDYTHPERQWSLHVTPQRLDQWIERFHAARANGVDFEVTLDHSPSARSVVGYLLDLRREGDRLMGVHEFIGEEAIALASRVKNVSVEIDPDFVDGKGNRYGESIVKSSLVQQPVVPGQLAFAPLAASRAGAPPDADASADVDDRLDERADDIADRLDSLVKLGRVTPHCRGLLRSVLVGERGSRPAYLLSRRASGTPRCLARMILDALEANEPVPLSRLAGPQTTELQRPAPDAGPADALVRARVERHNQSVAPKR